LERLRAAGVPFVSILTDPTTGGVFASYAVLGDVNIAEPNALIGFAGARVSAGTIAQELPPGFQRSEFLYEHGFLDLVVHRSALRDATPEAAEAADAVTAALTDPKQITWARVQLARNLRRPRILDLVGAMAEEFVELHGDRLFGDDEAVVTGLARIGDRRVVVVGQQKDADTEENIRRNFGMPHPEGYCKAMLIMELAERFGLPI